MTTKIAAIEVFGPNPDLADHVCCTCCDVYCHLEDLPDEAFTTTTQLYRIRLNDTTMLTDKHLVIREDLIDDASGVIDSGAHISDAPAPTTKPDPSTATFQARYVDLLDKTGITICEGRGPLRPQPLYRDDEHVGFVMPTSVKADERYASCAIELVDLPAVRALNARFDAAGVRPGWMTEDSFNDVAHVYNLTRWAGERR